MPSYLIEVENIDPSCSNDKFSQTIVANSCTEYIVRIDPSSTAKGPFNLYVNNILLYTNISRSQLVIGYFVKLDCDDNPTYLIYASTYNTNDRIDTVFYEDVGLNRRWGVGNGLSPEYSNTGWETFINRRILNNDRIINLTTSSGITDPTLVGIQLNLTYPSGSGNTSAILIYPASYNYISDGGLQEIGNESNIQGLKPKNNDRLTVSISGVSYYIAQITNYQGSEGQEQSWQVISSEP
jgi:hypothetical protein